MEGKRPGGLTALAVINFVLGGLSVLGFLGLVAFVAMASTAAEQNEEFRKTYEEWKAAGLYWIYVSMALNAILAALLITSGVGYLKMKRFLGRTLGNAYAVISIAGGLLVAVMTSEVTGSGFSIGTLVGLVYPVLTLIFLNTTFREDLTR